jgi:hypothetical protein
MKYVFIIKTSVMDDEKKFPSLISDWLLSENFELHTLCGVQWNKAGVVRINVTLRRVRGASVPMEK